MFDIRNVFRNISKEEMIQEDFNPDALKNKHMVSGLSESNDKDLLWKFSEIDRIEECAFNSVLKKFYESGVSGLVRENIQNSLDGKLKESKGPVKVIIKTSCIPEENIPGLKEIKERILSLEGRNNYTKETIKYMQTHMDKIVVDYISFEDLNTKGLTGAKNGQSNSPEDTWGIYAYNKGFHSEESDSDAEKSRGGSHGIGKIASNAASELHLMYFANCDAEGNKHLGGTVQLVEHKYGEKYYRSTGYFTDEKIIDESCTKFYPYENNFGGIFEKNTRGLKIIIPFLRQQFNNEDEIIRSVCSSFFLAIIEKKLEVDVNGKLINSETIKDYITDSTYYIQEISEIRDDFTPLYFNTYMNKDPKIIDIEGQNSSYKFKLYFNYDTEIPRGRVAIIRTIGMKIEDKKIKGNVNKPFNAVLIPDSLIEDEFLKSLENESHTELSFEHINDQKLQKNAKKFINNISNKISKIIDDEIRKNNPTDGIMDTKDVLYVIESQFKKDLSQAISRVRLGNKDDGEKGSKEKEIVKVNLDLESKKKKDKSNKKKKTDSGKLRKVKPRENEGEDVSREKDRKYGTKPDMVKRLILGNKEIVKFDFSESNEMKKSKVCDISLVVIDGMGQECVNEFNLNDNYESVFDKSSGVQCKIENNVIKDVTIVKGIAQIQFNVKEHYNKALKFVYYVEV